VANRACLHERVERAQRLLQRRLLVIEVRVVEVDAVSLQPLERGMRLGLNRLRAQVADCPTTATDLRCQDDLVAVATLGEPSSDDRLGAAVLDEVRVRGVDEVAAGGGIRVEDRVRLRLVCGPAENVGAEAEREDVEVGASE
jgi:hypothetical protein